MTSKLEESFNPKQLSAPGSETYLLNQAMEKAQKEKRDLYSQSPELLVSEIQKIAADFSDIVVSYGQPYFMAFVAGVLAERHGISIITANKATDAWNTKQKSTP